MANVAASINTGQGFGLINVDNLKCVVVSFATTATGDVLVFDTSNVGKENALSVIRYAQVCALTGSAKGGAFSSLVIASNQITVGSDNGAAATNCVAFCIGVGA